MDLKTISLEEFLAQEDGDAGPATVVAEEGAVVPPGTGHKLPKLKTRDGYSVVLLDLSGNVAVLDANDSEAGYYVGGALRVHDQHRYKGLGTALALFAYTYRTTLPPSRTLTPEGRRTMTAAWEVANGLRTSPWWP